MSARTSESPAPREPPRAQVQGALAEATVIDWPLQPLGPARAAQRVLAWARATQRDLIGLAAVVVPLTIVHAWGMAQFPAFFDDEGAYVSQAFAVDKLNALAPYTYWYDHPPLGWILLGGWAKLVPVFSSSSFAIGAARTFVLIVFVVSAALLYGVARRLSLGPGLSAAAVALFGFSPLALDYQRMVLLDNLAMPWLLAAFFLALTPRRRIGAYAASGVCFALAVLTKETFLLFLPALALVVWSTGTHTTRRFAIAVFGTLAVCVAGFYPLFALLRGELFEGKHHTSLMYGIHFQLTRTGGGSIFTAHSPTRDLVDTWLKFDPILLTGIVVLTPILLAIRRLRWLGLALAVPTLMAIRPGSYVPAMYVIGLLPFAALGLVVVANEAGAASRAIWRHPALRGALAAAGVLLVAVPAGMAAPLWAKKDVSMLHTNDAGAEERAVTWLAAHASRKSRILVDATAWTDLVDRGFDRHRIVWFYKLDLDPTQRLPWWKFDYVVRSNLLAGNLNWLPRSRAVYDHSRVVAIFSTPNERFEVRRVERPKPSR
jgi:4-amino-4-deoxy-L-arabinose transferase-like glycosyltransferase